MKRVLPIIALTAILMVPIVSAYGVGGTDTAQGQVNILGTCGVSFASGNPIDYGSLAPGGQSTDQTLVVHNTGSVSGTLTVSGTDWLDTKSASQMPVSDTKFSTATGTAYASKIALTTVDQTIGPLDTTADLTTYWQLEADGLSPTFAGMLSQTMTLTTAC